MNSVFLLTLLGLAVALAPITANLTIVQSQPLVFQLSFSQVVGRPQFQLFFNNIRNVPYQLLTTDPSASDYFFKAEAASDATTSLQIYMLLFNAPLSIGEGRLQVNSFTINASKKAIRTEISSGYAIFVLAATYLLSNFTLLGHIIIEYCQFYVLFMFVSRMSTTLYQGLSTGLLLIPPVDVLASFGNDHISFVFQCLTIPLFLIYSFGTIGFILKRCVPSGKSVIFNAFLEILTYNTFVNICNIFIVNLLYNSAQFLSMAARNELALSPSQWLAGRILVYFSLLTLVAIAYLEFYILNPKIDQNDASWQKYLSSKEFLSFMKLHEGINLSRWYTRNNILFILLKKLLVVGVFFTGTTFEYLIIFLEFCSLYYLFTIRPYKEELYMNIYFISRLLTFMVYGLIVLGDIYFSLGEATFNYSAAHSFLMVRDVLFLVTILVILGVIVREIYQKLSNLNYRIRVVREENEFKLQILERNRNSGTFEHAKMHHKYSEETHPAEIPTEDPSQRRITEKSETERKLKKSERSLSPMSSLKVENGHSMKKRKSQVNLQDVEIKVFRDFQIKPTKKEQKVEANGRGDRVNKIWKEQSLLEEMIKSK